MNSHATETGNDTRLGLVTRLLADAGPWASLAELLAEIRAAYALDGVGFRWPADGYAVFSGLAGNVSHRPVMYPVPVAGQTPGVLTVAGPGAAAEWLKLLSLALGPSGLFGRLFAPFADQARVAQRLDDAGRVAGRVAHDFDNVFQGVTGFAALALESLSPTSPAAQNVQEVQTAARHGMKFNAQLHQLHRAAKAQPFPAAVAAAVTREVARVAKQHPAAAVESAVPATLPAVAMEAGILQTVIGHLLDNAAQSAPKGGPVTVAVTARLVELAAADFAGFLGQPTPGPNVEIVIRDTGAGATDDARRKMFVEPFFTTKFRHRGLSLTVVYRTLYAHRGGVRADGDSGRGTTVTVVLPLAATPASAASAGRLPGGSS